MEKFSLTVNLENMDKMNTDRKQLEDLERLLERIKSLRNDIDKARLFDEIRVDSSDILLFVERIKDLMIKNFKRKLFLSLAQLEEQIKDITLKRHFNDAFT